MRWRVLTAVMLPLTSLLSTGVPTASAAVGDAARVRSSSHYLELVMYEASARSQTFRHLVEEIEHSDGIVYVEPGTCRHGVRSCLSMTLVQTGGFRMLRILVNPTGSPWGLMESIGHELRHALEVLANPALTNSHEVFLFYRGISSTARDAFETPAALHTGDAVGEEVARSRRVIKRDGHAVHRWQ